MATYQISGNYYSLTSTNVYFGSKLVSKGSYATGWTDDVALTPFAADRLGSTKKFYPFGTERPSASANDTEKFTGYFRDASTGLDYADQRYHQPGVGRFLSPDPYKASAGPEDPASWNRYAYVKGDPVNWNDPTGLDNCAAGDTLPCSTTTTSSGIDTIGFFLDSLGIGGIDGGAGVGEPMPWAQIGKGRYVKMLQCSQPVHPGVGSDQINKMIAASQNIITTAMQNGSDPIAELTGYLIAQFEPGGGWDYKNQYQPGTTERSQAQVFGNFAFGAVMESLGLTYPQTQKVAGVVQSAICLAGGACGQGIPLVLYPYGDQVGDALDIERGYTYERLTEAGQCP